MGPLPTWGWLAVAVGGIFLYRRMTGGGGASGTGAGIDPATGLPYGTDPTTGLPYGAAAGGNVGGVFLLPAAGSSPAGSTTAPTTTTAAPADPFAAYQSTYAADQASISGLTASGQYGTNLFLSRNAAAATLGLPHVIGQAGNAFILNPATGQSVPSDVYGTLTPEAQNAIVTGNPSVWSQLIGSTGPFASGGSAFTASPAPGTVTAQAPAVAAAA